MKHATTAHEIAELAEGDGQSFPDEFAAALESRATQDHEHRGVAGAAVRHQFADGSAIVEAGDGWDYGVHADRLAAAAERYSLPEETNRDVRFAWVGAGYGLTDDDAEPGPDRGPDPGTGDGQTPPGGTRIGADPVHAWSARGWPHPNPDLDPTLCGGNAARGAAERHNLDLVTCPACLAEIRRARDQPEVPPAV